MTIVFPPFLLVQDTFPCSTSITLKLVSVAIIDSFSHNYSFTSVIAHVLNVNEAYYHTAFRLPDPPSLGSVKDGLATRNY